MYNIILYKICCRLSIIVCVCVRAFNLVNIILGVFEEKSLKHSNYTLRGGSKQISCHINNNYTIYERLCSSCTEQNKLCNVFVRRSRVQQRSAADQHKDTKQNAHLTARDSQLTAGKCKQKTNVRTHNMLDSRSPCARRSSKSKFTSWLM